jgi:hypothetical protein
MPFTYRSRERLRHFKAPSAIQVSVTCGFGVFIAKRFCTDGKHCEARKNDDFKLDTDGLEKYQLFFENLSDSDCIEIYRKIKGRVKRLYAHDLGCRSHMVNLQISIFRKIVSH